MLCGHHAIDHLIHACANVRSPLQCVGTVANVVTVMPMAMKSTGVQSWACSAPHAACNREVRECAECGATFAQHFCVMHGFYNALSAKQ